jgi:hypothetical protein
MNSKIDLALIRFVFLSFVYSTSLNNPFTYFGIFCRSPFYFVLYFSLHILDGLNSARFLNTHSKLTLTQILKRAFSLSKLHLTRLNLSRIPLVRLVSQAKFSILLRLLKLKNLVSIQSASVELHNNKKRTSLDRPQWALHFFLFLICFCGFNFVKHCKSYVKYVL